MAIGSQWCLLTVWTVFFAKWYIMEGSQFVADQWVWIITGSSVWWESSTSLWLMKRLSSFKVIEVCIFEIFSSKSSTMQSKKNTSSLKKLDNTQYILLAINPLWHGVASKQQTRLVFYTHVMQPHLSCNALQRVRVTRKQKAAFYLVMWLFLGHIESLFCGLCHIVQFHHLSPPK